MGKVQVVILSIVLLSCSKLKIEEPEVPAVYYYNFDSLLKAQTEALVTQKASISKKAWVDNDSSAYMYRPDSGQWADELNILSKIDINKPVLRDAYTTKIEDDPNSNLRVKSFSAKKPQDVEVKYFKLYYLQNIENLRRIEIYYNEKNPVYKSSRDLTLLFDHVHDKILLERFEIKGGQKMIMKDSVQFLINTGVIWP